MRNDRMDTNGKSGKIWKDAWSVLSWHLFDETEENHEVAESG
jgi:hypothetical protein